MIKELQGATLRLLKCIDFFARNLLKEALAEGENVYIRGFGSFITKKRAAKVGRNIKQNTSVNIPEHYIPAFKPAKEFADEVKKLKTLKSKSVNEEY